MSEEWDPADVFAVLDDEYARAILEATSRERLSAKALSEECEMSRATVSRRVNALTDHGFLAERLHVDPDGHHHREYEARLDRIDVTLREGRFDVRVELREREDVADRFTRLWGEMRRD